MVSMEELHTFAVEAGIAEDPRSQEQIKSELEKRAERYNKLDGPRKEHFDEDSLENPFDDSKVLYGRDASVETLAVGMDIATADMLLVDRLNADGAGIDGVITHHPAGKALANLAGVMDINVDVLHKAGIPVSQAEGVVKGSRDKVRRRLHSINHPRAPQAAERLGLPFMSLHTVTDNHAYQFVKDYVAETDPYTLKELINALLDIPEYAWALKYGVGPEVFAGSEDNRAGEVGVLAFTGGTDVGADLIEKMVDAGIDTLLAMHATQEEIEAAKEASINVISAGHMSSDSLGMNLLLDKVQDEYSIDVVDLAGFKRVER